MSSPYPITMSSDNLELIILSKQPEYLGGYDEYSKLYSDGYLKDAGEIKAEENELTDFSYPTKATPKTHSFHRLGTEKASVLKLSKPFLDPGMDFEASGTILAGQLSGLTTMTSLDSIPMLSHSASTSSLQFSPSSFNLTQTSIPEFGSGILATPNRTRNRSASTHLYTTPLHVITSPTVYGGAKVGKTPRATVPLGHSRKRSAHLADKCGAGHTRTPSAGNPFYTPRALISPLNRSPDTTSMVTPTYHQRLDYGKHDGDEDKLKHSQLLKRRPESNLTLRQSFSLDSIALRRERDADVEEQREEEEAEEGEEADETDMGNESLYNETLSNMTIADDAHNTSLREGNKGEEGDQINENSLANFLGDDHHGLDNFLDGSVSQTSTDFSVLGLSFDQNKGYHEPLVASRFGSGGGQEYASQQAQPQTQQLYLQQQMHQPTHAHQQQLHQQLYQQQVHQQQVHQQQVHQQQVHQQQVHQQQMLQQQAHHQQMNQQSQNLNQHSSNPPLPMVNYGAPPPTQSFSPNPFFPPPMAQRFASGPVPTFTHHQPFLSRSHSSVNLAGIANNLLATPPVSAGYMAPEFVFQPFVHPSQAPADKQKNQECPLCKMRFLRPEHVKRHLKSHSPAKPYVCDVPDCGKRFNRKDNMKAHLRKIHGIDTKQQSEGQFLVKSESEPAVSSKLSP